MKRLLVALVAAVAVSTGFAKVSIQQGFESNTDGFTITEGDASVVVRDSADTSLGLYPFDNGGSKYLELDTEGTVSCANSSGASYFDMYMQFNPSASAPELESDTKIAVYMNSDGKLVVIDAADTNVTQTALTAGNWYRLTIAAKTEGFEVRLGGDVVGTYTPITGNATITSVGFKGSGALDNFVARTTDPYFDNNTAVATIGGSNGERYASYSEALADALAAETPATITIPGETPKTMNGSASNRYEIASAGDLLALQNAVLANAAVRSLNYVQTANIDMAGVAGFYGIGWFKSSDSYASLPSGLASASTDVPFSGVYDGAGYKISNVRLVRHNYAGVFNCVEGTVKNLTVENLGFVDTSAGEWGCGIVGNAQGNAILEYLTSATSAQNGFWGDNAPHNTAGIAARAEDCATIRYCVNNAAITASAKRLGGIISFTGTAGAASDVVSIIGCTNNAAIYSSNGTRGVGGIIASPESATAGSMTLIKDCANFGAISAASGGYAGAIVGSMGVNVNSTWQDDGGNTFLASANLVGTRGSNTKAIVGLAYALPTTIDDVAYLTTVAQADLAAGNTYMLLADVAASETPVFTLEAVGDTIAFNTNGYNFAGTVAGTSTIVVTDSTVDAVKTFTAAAGVASVDDVAYATFADALAAIEDDDDETTDDFVTLIADNVAATIDSATTIKVKANGHPFTPTIVGDFALSTTTDENGITTYAVTEGVAAASLNGTDWTWFASFADAYAYILNYDNNVDIKVKIGANFVPTLPASHGFYSITFIATTEDPIDISLTDGTYIMSSPRLTFPANATLTAVSGEIASVSGGTLNVPTGVELTFNTYDAMNGITGLTGAGTIKNGFENAYYFVGNPDYKLPTLLRNSNWNGVLELSGTSDWDMEIAKFANANSKIRFNGFTTRLYGNGHGSVPVELIGDGLAIKEETNGGRTYTIGGTLTGTGTLSVAGGGTALTTVLFTGDATGFAGSIAIDSTANACVNFGTGDGGVTKAKQIGVKTGGTVTVAASKTWTASDFIFNGNVTLDGNLVDLDDNSIGKVWNNKDTAVLRVNRADACVLGNVSSWRGTYIVGWSPTGTFNPNNYGNANSTVALAADLAASAYFGSGSKTTLDILPAVRLDADIEIKNGYSETNDVALVTFAKLTGDHKFTTSVGTGSVDGVPKTRRYAITTLDNFTGSFKVKAGSELRIATVNVATGTDLNGRIIAAECDAKATVSGAEADGVITGALALTVAGEATGKTLTYDANGADGAGLYYVAGGESIEPGEQSSTTYDSEEAAAAVTNTVTIAVPTEVASNENISAADKAAYAEMFEAKVVPAAEAGKYTVVVDLKPAVEEEIQTAVDKANTDTLAAVLDPEVADSVTVTTKPGLYYQIVTGNSLPLAAPAADKWVMATGDSETISVTKPAGDAAFFKVYCSPTK